MKRILLEKQNELFTAISNICSLYVPADVDGKATYAKYTADTVISDALNTTRSPKDFFFPQSQDLMKFKTEGKNIEIIDIRSEHEDFAVFGVRACDVRAFDVLDKVFLAEPADSYYANRRAHGTIISLACTRPAETCFCQTFDIDATNPGGDISAWKTDKYLYLNANTDKGAALLDAVSSLLEDTDTAEVDAQKAKTAEVMKKLPLADLSADKFGDGKTAELFDRDEWKTLAESCLGCGTCTFVCPTCQCYDIKDFKTAEGVTRFRCWDSCMYSDFTQMSAGQPRLTQTERFRQRFMHKLVYFPTNNEGMFSCVGCGRCLSRCPISMNIVKVMKTLGGND